MTARYVVSQPGARRPSRLALFVVRHVFTRPVLRAWPYERGPVAWLVRRCPDLPAVAEALQRYDREQRVRL